jgi:hypothetical protein
MLACLVLNKATRWLSPKYTVKSVIPACGVNIVTQRLSFYQAIDSLLSDYVLISFMKRTPLDHLQWPMRTAMLNVLREDILFSCQAPVLAPASSLSRSLSYLLPKSDLDKAKKLFMIYKAYYPTKTSFFYNLIGTLPVVGCAVQVLVCCVSVFFCALCVWCVRYGTVPTLGRKVRYGTVHVVIMWDNISGKENSCLKDTIP